MTNQKSPNDGERRIVITLHIHWPSYVSRAAIQLLLLWRKLRYGYTFRRIKLTQGQYAIVDAHLYDELNKHQWYAHKNKNTYYAYRAAKAGEKQPCKNVKMHYEVMKLQGNFINPKKIQNPNYQNDKTIIDHINGDGRDNRIANLRQANYSQNSQNRRKISRRCASQYKGVWFNKKMKKWRAQICFGGKKKHLGYYSDETEAAKAYDAAAIKYHGRFAKLNFSKRQNNGFLRPQE